MNAIIVGIFTSCIPFRAPNMATCKPSKIWNRATIISSCDAIKITSEFSIIFSGLSVSKYKVGSHSLKIKKIIANTISISMVNIKT